VIELHRANLIAVTPVGSVPDDLRPFLDFKAALLKIELKKDQQVAIFLIDTTACYIPIFLDEETTIDKVKEELAAHDAEMPINQEEVIKGRLKSLLAEKN